MWVLGVVLAVQLAQGHRILVEDDLAPAPLSMEEADWDYLDQDEDFMDEVATTTTVEIGEGQEIPFDMATAPEPVEDLLEITSDELEEAMDMFEDLFDDAPAPEPEEDPFGTASDDFVDLEEDSLDDAPAPEPEEDPFGTASDDFVDLAEDPLDDAPAPEPEEDPFGTASDDFVDLEEDPLDDAPAPEPEDDLLEMPIDTSPDLMDDLFEEDIMGDTLPGDVEAPAMAPEPEDVDLLQDADDFPDIDQPIAEVPSTEPAPSPEVLVPEEEAAIEVAPAPTEAPTDGPEEKPCTDIPPDNVYTCEEQRMFGKCLRIWMLAGDYCARTCGRCV